MTPQEAVVRNLYAAFAARDGEALTRLIADDAAWVVPGGSQVAGTYRGRAAIFDYFAGLARLSGGTFRAELVDVLVGAGSIAALARARGERAGRAYDGRYLLWCEVAGGQVTRAVLFNEDPLAFDAFWA